MNALDLICLLSRNFIFIVARSFTFFFFDTITNEGFWTCRPSHIGCCSCLMFITMFVTGQYKQISCYLIISVLLSI